ncbi:helix-hairpin-helix domain-containing protein [Tetragenococcus solitarius]|uniref:Competence protein ComEA n=1 Tax=Tetragenococcus solitarius TaxID=71453 RepID=A0ABP6KLT5_9ENTE|nr:helix-hairpin-helix domain-containing protein [Tetragenococcus solitarius]
MPIKERLKKFLPLLIATIITIFLLIFYFTQKNNEEPTWQQSDDPFQQITETTEKETEESSNKIIVDIKGEVNQPGVYELEGDARVKEGILKAGGLTKKAEEKQLNLAEKLNDQQMVYVPNKKEAKEMEAAGENTEEQNDEMIDINAADLTELQKINGIGPAKAQAIIDYREENGPFKTVDELSEISGFGEKTVEKLRDSIRI